MNRYYIAYGSNLSVAQMRYRCPEARIIGTGVLDDWRLKFKFHADIVEEKGFKVPVLVWKITEADERRLDVYEGFPKYYIKKELPVTVTTIKTKRKRDLNAMVYVMTEGVRDIYPPHASYYEILEEGYERFGFDKAILEAALEESYDEISK